MSRFDESEYEFAKRLTDEPIAWEPEVGMHALYVPHGKDETEGIPGRIEERRVEPGEGFMAEPIVRWVIRLRHNDARIVKPDRMIPVTRWREDPTHRPFVYGCMCGCGHQWQQATKGKPLVERGHTGDHP